MKKSAKILSLAVILTLLLGSLAGCAGSGKATQTPADKSSGAAASSAAPEKVYTISWVPQNDAPVDMESPVVKEMQRILNVKFDFIYMDRSKAVELLNMRIASGEIPDVMRVDTNFRSYISQGIIMEIPEDTVKKVAPTLYSETIKNGGANAWEFPKENGKLYGLPYLFPMGPYHNVSLWRDDWLKNVGIDKIPETLAEAEAAFYKFVNEDPDKNGKKDTYALSNTGMNTVFYAYGANPYGMNWSVRNGKVVYSAVLPEMKEALTLLNKWYKDKLIDPEFINKENKGQAASNAVSFWNGVIGYSSPGLPYQVNPPYNAKDLGSANYQNFTKLQPNGSYTTGKPLIGPSGKAGAQIGNVYGGSYVVMGKDVAKEPGKMEKILEINEKLASDFEFDRLIRYGIKGLTYDEVEGQYTYIGDATTAGGQGKLGLVNGAIGYLSTTNFDFCKKFEPTRYAYADKVGRLTDNFTNPVWDSLPSYGQYRANITKMVEEAYILFIIGNRKIDEFDKFVDELNKAGLEQLTKEANEWYAKYNKK